MYDNLWIKIFNYQFDALTTHYGFSIRLAHENNWTRHFTEKAILEYKKFMYLAATSDLMVSPSPIIDIVWHQHLIFTPSYSDFCDLLGKRIQHVPSTRSREEAERFRHARERTQKLYSEKFGEAPKDVWECDNMFTSLNLPKSTIKIRSFLWAGILVFMLLILPCYFLLKPLYVLIPNPGFILGYLLCGMLVFAGLEMYNRFLLKRIFSRVKDYSFIHHLHSSEVIYLKCQHLMAVVKATFMYLVDSAKIVYGQKKALVVNPEAEPDSREAHHVVEILKSYDVIYETALLKEMMNAPVFRNVSNGMNALRKYVVKSKAFGRLFCVNFVVLAVFYMLGVVRFTVGMTRQKPVMLIASVLLLLLVGIIYFLQRLTFKFCTRTIPEYYSAEVSNRKHEFPESEWKYFLMAETFYSYRRGQSDLSSTGCGSSCGSGCGSSCGGCGGD